MLNQCFATTIKGLEHLLLKELSILGATNLNAVNAGIEFTATFETIMKANLHSRLASRIMLQVGFGGYRNHQDIYNIARKIKWDNWFHIGNPIKVSTTAIRSPLKSLEFVTLKVKDAICDHFTNKVDARPNVDKQNPDIRIYNFLTADTITIYIDTSGEALFKRGYRTNKLEAPLKENLAAGIIQLTNWNPNITFYDPMCGSGTLAIEAISYGLNIAPGLNRNFGFEHLLLFDKNIFKRLQLEARQLINHNQPLKIYLGDINSRAIITLKDNLQKAGFIDYAKFDFGDFLTKDAPDNNGFIITNPPYGIRLDQQKKLAELYPKLGNHLKRNFTGWNCYFFTHDPNLAKLIHLKPNSKHVLFNGTLECKLLEFKMVKGSNCKPGNSRTSSIDL